MSKSSPVARATNFTIRDYDVHHRRKGYPMSSKSNTYVKNDIVYYHVECDCGNTVDGSVVWSEWNSTEFEDSLHDAIWFQEKCPVCLDWPVVY